MSALISRDAAAAEAAAAGPQTPAEAVEASCGSRSEVQDPEIPVSVVGMGLIVSLARSPPAWWTSS